LFTVDTDVTVIALSINNFPRLVYSANSTAVGSLLLCCETVFYTPSTSQIIRHLLKTNILYGEVVMQVL